MHNEWEIKSYCLIGKKNIFNFEHVFIVVLGPVAYVMNGHD